MQITSAMKMVSAAKLKKAHDAVVALNPYCSKIKQIIGHITYGEERISSIYAERRPVKNLLIVCVTSNRGLCGAFNSNVIKEVLKLVVSNDAHRVSVACIGKRGSDILKKNCNVIYFNETIFDDLSFENSELIANEIMQYFIDKQFDKIFTVHNYSKTPATQIIQTEQFLPILPNSTPREKTDSSTLNDYIFEPSKSEILQSLIPKALKVTFYKILRNSFEAEHGARMTAMHKATDNAQELKDKLTLKYNKERQATITGEILEIVGGAEALNS
ncbi:ATP synthase gamma chain [Elysia marginata]|uniref:F-ATPase gamma subunit n=1 Tax=Elysia marginata TaxID=1093978 RepID=A0AAV4FMB7_9GAST|nr:ATP synthase gamma chain [Elysia marginata]